MAQKGTRRTVIPILTGFVRIAQGAQLAAGTRLGERTGGPSWNVAVLMPHRGEACDICGLHGEPFLTYLCEGGLPGKGLP
jgi:hypothetical protein